MPIEIPGRLDLHLPNQDAARKAAQEIADKTGQVVVVTDEQGQEVCKATPRLAHKPA